MASVKINLISSRNKKVDSILRQYKPVTDDLSWYSDWFSKMYDLSGQPLYEDSEWEVPKIWNHFHSTSDCLVLIIEAYEKIQGYIVLEFNKSDEDGLQCSYIPFLSVAPWNRRTDDFIKRQFTNIGKILVAVASGFCLSKNEDPRILLHSLPEAEGFYKNIGMEKTGRSKNGLLEFKLDKNGVFDLMLFLSPYLETK